MNSLTGEISIKNLSENISRERKIISELNSLYNYMRNAGSEEEKRMVSAQIQALKNSLAQTGQSVIQQAEKVSLFKPLPSQNSQNKISQDSQALQVLQTQPAVQKTFQKLPSQPNVVSEPGKKSEKIKPDNFEKKILKRMQKKEKKVVKQKAKKPSKYIKFSSKLFYDFSMKLLKQGKFKQLRRDLVRANLEFVPAAYISLIFLTTLLSVIVAFFIMLFFLFFNLVSLPPFIVLVEESFGLRFLKVFWILFAVPAVTFLFTYFYPGLEKRSIENKINQELPFATIHMSSISSSLVEPSKIFSIIILTKEYPHLEKEFIKLQNEINIYGYDLVTALRNRAFNSPSRKLSELFNGLATTITSGGNLPEFFEKRSQTLLFEHRLDEEKQAKAAETFMDIYISVVIAAPMILMLLLMMMRISGLGISLSPGMITLVMVLGVGLVNILFLTFLHLKQPEV